MTIPSLVVAPGIVPPTPIPTFEGFQAWVVGVAGVPATAIDDTNSFYLAWAWNTATAIVLRYFLCVPGPIYLQMVYNLGMDRLANWCMDIQPPVAYVPLPGQPPNGAGLPYFAYLRNWYGLNNFTPGLIDGAYDQGTGQTMKLLDVLEGMTIAQLQYLKTPWGRTYLGYAQDWGTNWGIT
jgi:hypothetical protein